MKKIIKDTVIVEKVAKGARRWDFSVEKDAKLTFVFIVSAATDVELLPSIYLVGDGAAAIIIGLITGSSSAHVRVQTLQHHKARDTTSRLLVKSVLRNESMCAYKGSILVDKAAQQTDAYQRNENLLLDEHTQATSSPVLEILANDVRCTHGAVVKTLDDNELWYLASRGIDRTSARDMMADGFLRSALSLISDTMTREKIKIQL